MKPQSSKAIFGIGIALSIASIVSIYINMQATQNQDRNIQGNSPPQQSDTSSSDSVSTASPPASTGTSISVTIPNGAAAQASSLNGDYYTPMTTNVSSGSKVTWTNQDVAAHTSTSGRTNNSPDSGQLFNTGTISPGSSGSAVIKSSGKIQYHCMFHPWMIASLQIIGSSQAPGVGSTPPNANVGTIQQQQQTSTLPTVNDSKLKVTEVVSNLSMPTTIAFLGSDDFLLLQKGGTVSRVTNGTLLTPPLLNVTVGTGMTQGMLGVTISNNSNTNSTFVFLYYTEVINKEQTNNLDQNQSSTSELLQNRLYRYELVSDRLVNPKLLAVLPAKEGYMDNGGYMKIGPDNNLYFSVGAVTASDVSDVQTLTQNFVNGTPVDGRAGILRMTQDGDPVLDKDGRGLLGNSSPLNLYYGYGLKDTFGMDFDPVTGNLWDAEPGRLINDEINLVKPGFNGGFEAIQGQSVYTPAAPADLVSFNGTGIYHDPEFVWTQKVVPVGLTFLSSNKLGTNYENDLFLGSFLNGNLYHFDLNENRSHLVVPSSFVYKTMATWNSTGAEEITFGKGFDGISSMIVGPDGYLYVVSFGNGVIYRIAPVQ